MKRYLVAIAIALVLLVTSTASAGWRRGIGVVVPGPVVYSYAPGYAYYPAPVVATPTVVPAPAVVAPAPAYYYPGPAVVAPRVYYRGYIGRPWHGTVVW
jgi:hypothetical protein